MEIGPRCDENGFLVRDHYVGPNLRHCRYACRACKCLCQCLCVTLFLLCLILSIALITIDSRDNSRKPGIEVDWVAVHSFNLTRKVQTSMWRATGNFTVVFHVHRHSPMLDFRHKYLSTLVSAFYQDTLLGQSQVARFTQVGDKLPGKEISATIAFRDLGLNESVALAMQSESDQGLGLRIGIDAVVTVVVQARNPSWPGLQIDHQYLLMLGSAFYEEMLLGQAEVAQFALVANSYKNVCVDGVFSVLVMNKSVGFDPRRWLRITVAALVMEHVKEQDAEWHNRTCWVDTSAVEYKGCNHSLTDQTCEHEICGSHYKFSKNCTVL